MAITYERNNWEDAPSTATPINAENLNCMESGIEAATEAASTNEAEINALKTTVGNKADVSDVYTITELDGTLRDIENSIAAKADKTYVDSNVLVSVSDSGYTFTDYTEPNTLGYYIRYDNGVLTASDKCQYTDYISCAVNDQFRVTAAYGFLMSLAVFYDSGKNYIGYYGYEENANTKVENHLFTVNANTVTLKDGADISQVAYVRFNNMYNATSISAVLKVEKKIVGKRPISEIVSEHDSQINSLNEKTANPLSGKTIYVDGDSIAYGAGNSGRSYAEIIAERNGMTLTKRAVGGSTLAYNADDSVASIYERVTSLTGNYDYILLEGGINDVFKKSNARPYGAVSDSYTYADFDETTPCGALEKICYYLVHNFSDSKILFVLTHHKGGNWVNKQNELWDLLIQILSKWGIPFVDLSTVSHLSAWDDTIAAEYFDNSDGTHPNEIGYQQFYVPVIEKAFIYGAYGSVVDVSAKEDTSNKATSFDIRHIDESTKYPTVGAVVKFGTDYFVKTDDYDDDIAAKEDTANKVSAFDTRNADEGTKYPTVGAVVKFGTDYFVKTDDYEDGIAEINQSISTKAEASDLNMLFKQTELTLHENQYIYNTGVIASYDGYAYSDPVNVPAGCKVKLRAAGYSTNVAMISRYKDGTYIPLVISVDDTVRDYEYQTAADDKLVFCYRTKKDSQLFICRDIDKTAEKVSDIDGRLNLSLDNLSVTEGKYINAGGTLSNLESYSYTAPMYIPAGYDISLIGRGTGTNVAMIAIYNGENSYTPVVISNGDEVREYTHRTEKSAYYAFCYRHLSEHSLSVKGNLSTLTDSVSEINNKITPYSTVALFKSIGVVGDSYSSGQIYLNAGTHWNNRRRSWGEILARRNGADCVTYSEGGLTTRSWLTSSYGLQLLESRDPDELYLLALGINDVYSIGIDYLGTIADADEARNDSANPDTFYGNYAKIIARVQDHAPKAKIVLMTLHEKNNTFKQFNEAIIALAEYFNIAYIVQDDDPFFTSDFYNTNKSEAHPSAVGYSGMAAAIERLLEKCMVDQFDYFKDAFMYEDTASNDKVPDGAVTESKLSAELQNKINSVVNSLEAIENGTY